MKNNERRGMPAAVWVLAMVLLPPAQGIAESLSAPGRGLFSSERFYQTGDLVTVIVSETAQGGQSASTDMSKASSVGFTSGGALAAVAGSASVGLNSKQSGGGDLSRQGHMSAVVTARVEKVMENGVLLLHGEQEIEFDSGLQRISITGMARPRDITPGNEVMSNRLADAKIEFLGRGALNEKARSGFLGRFLEWLWIF